MRNSKKPDSKFRGSNLKASHAHNQRVVFETVRLRGPISRAEISVYTALTPQTISNIVDKLLDRGVLETIGRRSGRRGQPAIELNINPKAGYGIGVHLDRDLFTVVLLDLFGICHKTETHSWSYPSPEDAIPLIVFAVRQLVEAHGISLEELWGVGVALPGPIDVAAGKPINPPNFPGWNNIPLREILSRELSTNVFLETDATAAAEGERWFGQGRDISDYLYIYFGVGLGGGMILNGQPYIGGMGNAAMFGHMPVNPQGVRCACGSYGCLELYGSLMSLYTAIGVERPGTDFDEHVANLLRTGDSRIAAWLDSAADHFSNALVILEHVLSPSAIIFGGHLPTVLRERLIEKIEALLPERLMKALVSHPRLIQSNVLTNAVAMGAATLPLFSEFGLASRDKGDLSG